MNGYRYHYVTGASYLLVNPSPNPNSLRLVHQRDNLKFISTANTGAGARQAMALTLLAANITN